MPIAILVAVVTCVVAVYFEVFYNRKAKELGDKLPGPYRWPLVGNAYSFLGDGAAFLILLDNWSREYGVRLRAYIGSKLYILLTGASDVEAIMSTYTSEKSDEYAFLHPWLRTGLLTSSGTKWKQRRRMLTPAFHFKILENFIPVFNRNADIMIEKMEKYVGKDKFNVNQPVTMCTLDIISESAMGVSVNAQNDITSEYATAIYKVCAIAMMRMKSTFSRFDCIFNLTREGKSFYDSMKILHAYTDKMIKVRRQMLENGEIDIENDDNADIGTKKKLAFLDLLLLSTIDGEKLDDLSIREEVDTFLFEGHDTTKAAICFALHAIAGNEIVQNKLYEEQTEIFQNDISSAATFADLQNMKYMDATIKEVLRLYPSVPVIARKLNQNMVVNGLELPADSTIIINLYSLHRDPKVFENPNSFIPERFLHEETTKRNPYAYVAFSAGPRNCIGQKFAMLEMKMIISKILRNYKLISVDHKLILSADLILASLNGVYVKIAKR